MCTNHFDSNDIVKIGGKKVLLAGAVPRKLVVDSGHNYSRNSRDSIAENLTLWIMITSLLICWLPFLVAVFYCSDSGTVSPPSKRIPAIKPVSGTLDY